MRYIYNLNFYFMQPFFFFLRTYLDIVCIVQSYDQNEILHKKKGQTRRFNSRRIYRGMSDICFKLLGYCRKERYSWGKKLRDEAFSNVLDTVVQLSCNELGKVA